MRRSEETQENQDNDETVVDDDEVSVIPYSQTMWSLPLLSTEMNSIFE